LELLSCGESELLGCAESGAAMDAARLHGNTTEYPMILVVGAINVDVTAHVRGALDATRASTVVGSDEPPSFTQGGRGFNQAVACARLGTRTQLVALIGNDVLARRVIEDR